MSWSPQEIVSALEAPAADRRTTLREIVGNASVDSVIEALDIAVTPFTRRLLFDVLGEIRSPVSVQPILLGISDSDESVRVAAADALGKVFGYRDSPIIGEARTRALDAVIHRWGTEESPAVLSTLAQTMALFGDPVVAPLLEGALGAADRRVRGQAEWGLAYLARVGFLME